MSVTSTDDINLLLEFLEAPEDERLETAAHLRTMLDQQRKFSPCVWHGIPCRRPLGLHIVLSIPMADWLARALVLSPGEVDALQHGLAVRIHKQLVAQPGTLG